MQEEAEEVAPEQSDYDGFVGGVFGEDGGFGGEEHELDEGSEEEAEEGAAIPPLISIINSF